MSGRIGFDPGDEFEDDDEDARVADPETDAAFGEARDAFVADLSAALAPPGRMPWGRITHVDDFEIEVTPYFQNRRLWHRAEAYVVLERQGADLDFDLRDGDGAFHGWGVTAAQVIADVVGLMREAVTADVAAADEDDEDDDA
ncbi:hypothetical protein [Wenxinia marina]|uniref:Uncharacterized protein n=1 Tax=Wenxinia marina DSM 24838 TaxID=1123501 RepID=A0A0D0QCT3_9RHOB|nr:hypothetical protein [Wenxinia marina]KIQ68768.1 hypothetical protein Wenmar_02495 [Wenxinia marina DSM 24838]GGL65310.1 hypothetical protein GCM10011392_20030 [Wenxinia marina]